MTEIPRPHALHDRNPTQSPCSPPLIALTQGDSAGIGPEIILRAFALQPEHMLGCFVVGDVATFERARAVLGDIAQGLEIVPVADIREAAEQCARAAQNWHDWRSWRDIHDWRDVQKTTRSWVPVLTPQTVAGLGPAAWGRVSAEAGYVAAECVRWAAQAALTSQVAAITTAPLHKEALAAAGISHPGHTEFLQSLCAEHAGVAVSQLPVRMMLANLELRVVLHTIHVALREAIETLDMAGLLESLRIAHASLLPILGRAPRIAVPGLNPHAGEGGLFGREEIDHIAPAVAAARAQGMDVHGPISPDTVFARARKRKKTVFYQPFHPNHAPQTTPSDDDDAAWVQGEFDAVLALYHDQGLIPVKYGGIDEGVNVTLGLPIVRTSPDHGTAFDLAGRGLAQSTSFVAATRLARKLAAQKMPQNAA